MDLIPILSSVIVIATIITIVLAGLSYLAFKMRDRKGRKRVPDRPVFFRRYWPEELSNRTGTSRRP